MQPTSYRTMIGVGWQTRWTPQGSRTTPITAISMVRADATRKDLEAHLDELGFGGEAEAFVANGLPGIGFLAEEWETPRA